MGEAKFNLGWHRDLPDFRDFTVKSEKIATLMGKSKAVKAPTALPKTVDLRKYCSPIEDQQSIGSCTAQAGVGLVEYYEKRATGKYLDASRLFLYKATRNLLHWTGDTGAYLRTTMKAMVLFGVPPEEYWAYDTAKYDIEPSAFLYAYGQAYKTLRYYRLDPPSTTSAQVLKTVKGFLAAGYPSMFGFTVYNYGNADGEFDYPSPSDKALGGHAVVAVGYDDSRVVGSERGALRIRNSWGTGWGKDGYGWIPYKYITAGQAVDFWSVFSQKYLDSGKFR